MKRLYVAGQNLATREWVPVAELKEAADGYELRYTRGATRLPGFSGLSRMQALDKVYYSKYLFPFFSNRMLAKSRPEYQNYLRWLGVESAPSTPIERLSISGGGRATDNFEVISVPEVQDSRLQLNFFPRGLRYLHSDAVDILMDFEQGARIYLMKDVQNPKDLTALAMRSDKPWQVFIGYVPRYYCVGLARLLDLNARVEARIERINKDAPADMKLLVSISAQVSREFDLLDGVNDFAPLTGTETGRINAMQLAGTDLDL